MSRTLLLIAAAAALLVGCPEFPREELHTEAGGGDGGCRDEDGDDFTTCERDCNDRSADVNPGQTRFFTSPAGESFDYNCDGREEPELTQVVSCVLEGEQCVGEGWQDGPPKPGCGETAGYYGCQLQAGSKCTARRTGDRTQACR